MGAPAAPTPPAGPVPPPPRIAPRVLVDGVPIRAEQAVREALEAGHKFVGLLGGPGSGKTTTLAFLAQCLSQTQADFIDDATIGTLIQADKLDRPVVYAALTPLTGMCVAAFHLAAWGADERIEWAIGEPADRRAEFVRRATRSMEGRTESAPAVLAALWRQLASELELSAFEDALVRAVLDSVGDTPELWLEVGQRALLQASHQVLLPGTLPPQSVAAKLLRHDSVRIAVASAWLVEQLSVGKSSALPHPLPVAILASVAPRLTTNVAARATLVKTLASIPTSETASNSATLLHLSGAAWKPAPREHWSFPNALLQGVDWAGLHLPRMQLNGTNLARSNLTAARMTQLIASGARLRAARLDGADLTKAYLTRCSFDDASIHGATLDEAKVHRSTFERADLSYAKALEARFTLCSLQAADLRFAQLAGGRLDACDLTDADLTHAWLCGAGLIDLDLRTAALDDADLDQAQLATCRLEHLKATGFSARGATFMNCDLSASNFRAVHFRAATFLSCGLADVWWEGADLRDVDFRSSTFHMGSSRSGLVGSPLASEGTRTGFYTDDYTEQDFKPPEEISKADLRGADLRGAKVERVDFYLVDLRRALYDHDQAEWFRKCGAILSARV